jgi:hypothetical protein
MSDELLTERNRLKKIKPTFNVELINKYSKYVKSIGKRVVEGKLTRILFKKQIYKSNLHFLVELCWFQASPCQNIRLRMTEKQFIEGQKYIRSKSNYILQAYYFSYASSI